ncbi:MAG: ABC transporter ATP-binding protein [Candidatus Bathyarchaeota archaeon]|nr:ABC transporter ATP-binding protein [Candidatus Termiticorpusculum sp.]
MNNINKNNSNDSILKIENLSKIYKSGKRSVQPLVGLDLEIVKGEFVSVMGPSGSGKTTLLNIVGCIDRATSGNVFLDGVDVARLSEDKLCKIRRDKIGFVFQSFNLVSYLSARENVELAMELAGKFKGQRKQRALEFLSLVGLSGRELHRPSRLSQGEQQRVAIARALVNDPAIVLADEPTGNLDVANKQEIIKLLLELNGERGVSVVMVTHDEGVASQTGRVLYLQDGKIVQDKQQKNSMIVS